MSDTSRRDLFRKAAGLSALAPLILGADNKSGSAKPILGEGDHKYEVTHDWGTLPSNIKYGNTHGVCEDSQGHIYVHHTVNDASESHDTMVVYDAKGKFVRSWGKEFEGGAHGLHSDKEGKDEFLYLCDTKRGLVVKTTLAGEEVFTLGYPKESEVYKPIRTASRPPSTVRPIWPSRRTAISTSATATARTTSTSTTGRASTSAPSAARGRQAS